MVKAYVEGLYVGLLLAAEASRRQAMSQHIGHGTALCCRAVDILVVAGIGKLLDVHAEKEARLVRCGEPACGFGGEALCPPQSSARISSCIRRRKEAVAENTGQTSCRRKHRSTVAKNTGQPSQKTPGGGH